MVEVELRLDVETLHGGNDIADERRAVEHESLMYGNLIQETEAEVNAITGTQLRIRLFLQLGLRNEGTFADRCRRVETVPGLGRMAITIGKPDC